jgi:hypothetical protein
MHHSHVTVGFDGILHLRPPLAGRTGLQPSTLRPAHGSRER